MADTTPKSYSADPTLYLYTSLTAGSSHIITATSRLETILKANKIAFTALDVATDEKARMLWGRRSKGKKLPGLVKFGSIVGDLEEVEEWNEYGELKQQIGSTPVAAPTPTTSANTTPSKMPATSMPTPGATSKVSSDVPSPSPLSKESSEEAEPSAMSPLKSKETPLTMAMRQAGAEAAKKAGERKESKSKAQASVAGLAATEVPMPAFQTKMAKSIEDPSTSAETTAAKMPEKLAEEGAKRSSLDKIADEGAKRTSVDNATDSDDASEQGHVGLSKEATISEARRASSTTKTKSPLSEETAVTSSLSLGAADPEPTPKMHRGSSVSTASKEEIQEIEAKNSIPEETEDIDASSTKAGVQSKVSNVSATNEEETAATQGVQPQEQDPKDPKGAGVSVGD